MRSVTVHGTKDFIISVAQQISWLAAVCQEKRDQLAFAYVGFCEADHAYAFAQDNGSYWNNLVGPAVLATGFPIPDRKHNERGLEISIPVMAALADTPQAAYVDKAFPTRLKEAVKEDEFWGQRSFLGWCPKVLELLATEEYDYTAVQYPKQKDVPDTLSSTS
ncbi:hypothetical protein EDB81DRAFT_949068 [Dactylonectria macrodidyma]|uniref:Uncharacterized protein n=1 Tax=Dactylonectria macrodidyma TaxID=307937 RepID=A0A9P9IZQ6_9HYPO|nr:hypothetical protein EDB81DRAFT_949068 [Dactylonectria macrodidyma]